MKIIKMINQLNYNFIKLVSNYKELGIKETYIKKGDFIKKRFLKLPEHLRSLQI